MQNKKFEIMYELENDKKELYEVSVDYNSSNEDFNILYVYNLETAKYVNYRNMIKYVRMTLEDKVYHELIYSGSFENEENLF